jgi:hypothetical protein
MLTANGLFPVERYPLYTDSFRNLALHYQSLSVVLHCQELGPLSRLLREGVIVPITADQSVHRWLTEDICLSENYVEERISTVFLNRRPVADLKASSIQCRDSLALTSSSPRTASGLLRAVRLPWFSWRHHHRGMERRKEGGLAMVTVRVLDSLTDELGPPLLARGALVRGGRLAAVLPRADNHFWQECVSLRLNRLRIDPETLLGTLRTESEHPFIFRLLLGD